MIQTIGFIGAGNIAEAMISGLTKAGSKIQIRATNQTNQARLEQLEQKYNIIAAQFDDLVTSSDVLIIAVKPKNVQEVLQKLKTFKVQDKLIISVAAGIPMKVFNKYLPGIAVIRVMPNTSTAVSHSMTGLVRGENVTQEQVEVCEQIFSAVGHVLWIPEEKMNALIAMSGSGPAYFYLFTECLIQAGVQLGLNEKEAEILVRETLIGAGKMMSESGKSPGRLREEVTSPNGTTHAAISSFMEDNIAKIVLKAVQACTRRAKDMEGEYSD
jgi:pyrroline-5-carboxylate reductase